MSIYTAADGNNKLNIELNEYIGIIHKIPIILDCIEGLLKFVIC